MRIRFRWHATDLKEESVFAVRIKIEEFIRKRYASKNPVRLGIAEFERTGKQDEELYLTCTRVGEKTQIIRNIQAAFLSLGLEPDVFLGERPGYEYIDHIELGKIQSEQEVARLKENLRLVQSELETTKELLAQAKEEPRQDSGWSFGKLLKGL